MPRKKEERRVQSNITIENARIVFRNFSGKETEYNRKGSRNFAVLVDDEMAKVLADDGWNVKLLKPRDPEDDQPQPYLPVEVSFENYPPMIALVTDSGLKYVQEDTVHILDWVEIEKVDLEVRPYNWQVNDKFGVKAYLKSMYITIIESDLAKKYSNVPLAGTESDEE